MEDDIFSGIANGAQIEGKVLQTFQKNFVQVQSILDQNRLLINQINQNHESKIPDNLSRNVGLIRELNNNIRRVVDLYADLQLFHQIHGIFGRESAGTTKSDGRGGQKRIRSGN
ncbi:UNVERIFIED_CONTAM: protein ELF4-LIKE 4 [Sesamum radiatum]|uniref:Protein ELF4-LIKE 4 n=1 Tax=Sesamum radiatum TaxID=300843 RepID=A0AAW2PEB2_SESRA